MKNKYKKYLRLNIMPIIFILVSFISVTFAWFAYTGLSSVNTEIGVKAWHIELSKNGQPTSNEIVVSLDNIYPGMDIVHEKVNIKNLGDSDATLKYSIKSARLLDKANDNYVVNETTTSEYVEDLLSHNYPFHININLSKNYILAHGDEGSFEVSVSWPLDSDNDALDSLWGTEAYDFKDKETKLKEADPNYEMRSSLQIIIEVSAEQYLENDIVSDPNYDLGDSILFDVVKKEKCTEISATCLKTYVIDINNKLGDENVTLLPDPTITYNSNTYANYITALATITKDWKVTTRPLVIDDILKIVAKDITGSMLIRNNISDDLIGNLNYTNRVSTELSKAIRYNGYYKYINEKFSYLSSSTCYWTNSNYDLINAFAVKNIDATNSKVYNESKSSLCNVIPVIVALKTDL